jgi:hypothetical protein
LIQQWIDDDALSIVERIESSPQAYPFIHQYSYWPGPNSNTFAQWIVRGKAKLGIRAIGRNFPVSERHGSSRTVLPRLEFMAGNPSSSVPTS